MAALLTWGMVICAPMVRAAEPANLFTEEPFAIEATVSDVPSGWLTSENAFSDESLVPASLPLLRITAGQASPAPIIQASHEQLSDVTKSPDNVPPTDAPSLGTLETINSEPAKLAPTEKKSAGSPRVDPLAGLQQLGAASPSALDQLPRLILTTLIILATCAGTLLLARRWLMKSGMVVNTQRDRRLQIVASLSITPRSQLHVVRFDDREVLVGVDSRGLQQIQIVTPSFDALLQSTREPEFRTLDEPDPGAVRSARSALWQRAAA